MRGSSIRARHESLITEELFERVQRILDSHSGSGTRYRSHNHYLKGLLYCGRCKYRLVVQRTQGRHGGEYFYFFCRGRQQGLFDLPFIPVEVLEEAVVRYYGDAVSLPADWLVQVRAGLDEAVKGQHGLTDTLRERYAKRLDALDRKESYFLDLAADQGWPKEKLRIKIDAIRHERKEIEDTLAHSEHHLDRGREVFHHVLALLHKPQAYEQGDEAVRSILNRAYFTRLYVDGGRVIDHEMNEPFDILSEAYRVYQVHETSSRVVPPSQSRTNLPDPHDRASLIGSLALAMAGQAWNKPPNVGDTGIEPVTSAV
jgi:site-specific DNA recombinase